MKRITKNLFLTGILLSLFLHLGTAFVVYLKKPLQHENAVEVVLVEKPHGSKLSPNLAKQIVEQDEKRINDEIDEKAKYLSRHNQKVVNETKADHNGKFQNDAKMGAVAKAEKKNAVDQKIKTAKNAPKTKNAPAFTSPYGDVALPKLADLQPQFHWDKVPDGVPNPGPISQSDDYLKNVHNGPQTLLSTREFVYYTYFSRIKDRLRLFWEPKIKEKMNRLFVSGRHIASDENHITRVVIVLDHQGKLLKVHVIGSAGVQDLDDAATEAFQLAAPFPNPPKGMVDGDGTIHIPWDFVLEANSGVFAPPPPAFAQM